MKLLRTCSISLALALALLIMVQAGAFAFIEQLPPSELTARADTVSMGKAPDITTSKEGQGGDFTSAKQLTSAVAWTSNTTSLEELTNGADSVIVGTVIERSSYWNDEHTGIYTSVVLSADETLKGQKGKDSITLTLPGGEVDGIGLWISDMPSFDQGEKAVVFLKKLSKEQIPKVKDKEQLAEEQFEVYGGYRGKFTIKQGKVGNLPVAQFKERVSKVLKGQTLTDEELDVPSSPVISPYSYGGMKWPGSSPVVNYRINENTADCSGEGAAVQAAAATWSAAGAYFSFSYAGTTTATVASFGSPNGVNEILWRDLGSGGTIAHTITWSIVSTSTIVECDMEFNDYYTWSTAATPLPGLYDTQTIGLHEFGHYLKLLDLYDPADSAKVMYGYGSPGTTLRALHADDIAGIQSIYGALPTAPTVTNYTGASNIAQTSARLNGQVTSAGGENPTVHIYWGPSNGGTTSESWAHDVNLGVKAAGTFYTDISSLTASTTYYYRCYAVNSGGGSWAASTASFATSSPPTPPTMEAIVEAEGAYYNTAPVLSNFGFDDETALDDGWYQMGSYTGSWTSLFTDVSGAEWNSDSWTIPGFGDLSEGSNTIYFRASDDVGNLDGESGEWSWQFYKDTVAPADPTSVNSTSHTVSTWSSDNTVDIGWTDAIDSGSGLDGYSVLWDAFAATVPDQTKDIEEDVQSANSTALADGDSYYFHIRSVDNAENWQSTIHVGPFYIETVPPTDPTGVSSPSHTESIWSSDNTVDMSWTDATDATSGLDGYSVLWDAFAATIPDQTKDIEEGVQSANSTALADGNSNYFHITSVDNAGNWQSTIHVGPFFIDANPPADPTSVNSTSHTVSTWSSDNTVDITWTDAIDSGSGLDGYSVLWSENATSMPDQTKNIEEGVQSASSTDLVDGDSHYFHIISVDNFGNWQSTVHYGPFYIAVNCPILSEGTVNPTSGYTSAGFTYSVNYTDFEDDTPDSIKISINSGASVNMTARAGQDDDFTNGEIYEYIISGGTLGTGSHTFQFFANDGTDDAIGDIDVNNGPTVSKAAAAGGGGGGGGGAPPPGVTKVIDVMSSKGEFKENVTCKSEDECVELYIPENTIAKRTKGGPIYTIKIIESEDPPPAPEQTNLIGLVYDFSPEGITFDPAVDLTIKYDESLMTEGVNENSLIIAIWDSDAGKWVELEGTVDPENNTITTKIAHFTEYTILVHTTPASFTVTNLSIVPKEIDLGESATVSVTVTNTGDLSGECELYLKTDDVISQTKEITLTGGSSQKVTFSVSKDIAGECCVDINELTGSLVVREEVSVAEEEIEPAPEPAAIPVPEAIPTLQPSFSRGLLVGILAGVAAIGSTTYYVVRKRIKAKGSG